MVLLPDVVTVGLPVVVPVYLAVGIDRITTPEPPAAPAAFPLLDPPPPPVFAVPAVPTVSSAVTPAPPPPVAVPAVLLP